MKKILGIALIVCPLCCCAMKRKTDGNPQEAKKQKLDARIEAIAYVYGEMRKTERDVNNMDATLDQAVPCRFINSDGKEILTKYLLQCSQPKASFYFIKK